MEYDQIEIIKNEKIDLNYYFNWMVEFIDRAEFDDTQKFMRIALILDEMRSIGEQERLTNYLELKEFCHSDIFFKIQNLMRVDHDLPELRSVIASLIEKKLVFSEESDLFF